MLKRMHFDDRETWLSGRGNSVGASEAAAIIGVSPWTTTLELWKLKTGQKKPKDLSTNSAVERGVRMEPAIRTIYSALHPDTEVKHFPFDILYQSERPWLTATLDGELVDENRRNGILEIKTGELKRKADFQKWDSGSLPQYYFVQTLWQLAATDWEFVDLIAMLERIDGSYTIYERRVERSEHEEDIKWLVEQGESFWNMVETRKMPPMPLTL